MAHFSVHSCKAALKKEQHGPHLEKLSKVYFLLLDSFAEFGLVEPNTESQILTFVRLLEVYASYSLTRSVIRTCDTCEYIYIDIITSTIPNKDGARARSTIMTGTEHHTLFSFVFYCCVDNVHV